MGSGIYQKRALHHKFEVSLCRHTSYKARENVAIPIHACLTVGIRSVYGLKSVRSTETKGFG